MSLHVRNFRGIFGFVSVIWIQSPIYYIAILFVEHLANKRYYVAAVNVQSERAVQSFIFQSDQNFPSAYLSSPVIFIEHQVEVQDRAVEVHL